MASYEGAKAVFGGMSYNSNSWQRADTNIFISKPSLSSRGESVVVSSTTIHDTNAQDAILAGGVAMGLIAVLLLVCVVFFCHVMGLHNKLCGGGCWQRRGGREAVDGNGGPPEPSGGAVGADGSSSARQVNGMTALLELSTPRLPGHRWQAGALRRQAPPESNSPPPSYSIIYNSKAKKVHRPSPSNARPEISDVIVLWRIIVEATQDPNREANDHDLPVFESPPHSLGKNHLQSVFESPPHSLGKNHSQSADGRCHSPARASTPSHRLSTSSVFEGVVTPQSVPRLILDDRHGRKVSESCLDSDTTYKDSPRFEHSSCHTSPNCMLIDEDPRLATPKVSFFKGEFERYAYVTTGVATHDTGYSSCFTAESERGRKRLGFSPSVERCYTQPRPAIRRNNLNVFTNSLGDIARQVSESPARLVLVKYQITPHGRYMLNLNSKFATRARQNGASTGSYMETIHSKDSASELLEPLEISELEHDNAEPNYLLGPNSPRLHRFQQSPSCPLYCSGMSLKRSPNQTNSCETFGCKLESVAKVPEFEPRVTVRVALPTGDVSGDIAATKEGDNGTGNQNYVALFKAHPLYPIQACSVQVYSSSHAVSVVKIECLSSDCDVVESFKYGLVTPSDKAIVDDGGTSP